MSDELKILITGDTGGIETAMKKALNVVQGGVNEMNDQTVDWTSIFSRAVSPAIISGVASVFAFAIEQSLQFGQAMNTAGNAVGMTSGQISGSFAPAMQKAAATTGDSVNDLNGAFDSLYNQFNQSTSITSAVVSQLGELSTAGFGSASTNAQALEPVLASMGVTTQDAANTIIQAFLNASQESGVSIASLAQSWMSFQGNLKDANVPLSDMNGLIVTFGANVGKMGGASGLPAATAAFSLMTTALTGANPQLNAAVGSVASLKAQFTSGDFEGAINSVMSKATTMSPLLQAAFSLDPNTVGNFKSAVAQYPTIAAEVSKTLANEWTVQGVFDNTNTAGKALGITWQSTAKILEDSASGLLPLQSVLDDIASKMQVIAGVTPGSKGNAIADLLGIGAGAVAGGITGGEVGAAIGTAILPGIGTAVGAGIGAIGGAVAGGVATGYAGSQSTPEAQLSNYLASTGVNFSSSQLSQIDTKAGSDSMIQSLISALQTGIKSGQYTTLNSTFNLNVPQGSQGLIPKQIAQQLYNMFQGTQ